MGLAIENRTGSNERRDSALGGAGLWATARALREIVETGEHLHFAATRESVTQRGPNLATDLTLNKK
jgi:hypothetical protein